MLNNADIYVNFGDGDYSLSVKCIIKFGTPVTAFRFSLSTLMIIDNISADWNVIREWQPQWQHKSNEIEVSSDTPISELTIEYHGFVSGWCNIIEEKRIALSSYSAWTISAESIRSVFYIENMEEYFVINARFDIERKLWIYGETDHDEGNIIALKKGYYRESGIGNFRFYYLNENEHENIYADCYAANYDNIMAFYTSVFGKKDIDKMTVVSLGIDKGGGAYFRNELMVIDKINIIDDIEQIKRSTIGLLGHELGHNWFTGADTTIWEDWLNETGAEWAALLYILSLNDNDFFTNHISWAIDNYAKTPVIKSIDGKRPSEGVHIRGVAMFYAIYRKYGIDTITKVLQILADLQIHTTEAFIKELNDEIAEFIGRNLTAEKYF